MNKEEKKIYMEIYYENHKNEYRKRDIRWRKDHPKASKTISKRYREKVKEKGNKHTNKSSYEEGPLKVLFVERYGKCLRKTTDDVTNTPHKARMICVDCLEYKTKGCPGWAKCKYKEEILEEIKR